VNLRRNLCLRILRRMVIFSASTPILPGLLGAQQQPAASQDSAIEKQIISIETMKNDAMQKAGAKETVMRSVLVLLLLTLAIGGVMGGQNTDGANTNADVEKQIVTVDDEKDHAMQLYVASHGEVGGPELDQIYADDLVFVTTHGALLSKAQRMEDLRCGNLKFISFGRDSYGLHVYGDTVVMTGRATSKVKVIF
jgi:hypothetical protein